MFMRHLRLLPMLACCSLHGQTQSPIFEGSIVYRVAVHSKVDNVNDEDMGKVLCEGNTETVSCKNGNYRRTSVYNDQITIAKDKKIYLRFPKLDTLYFMDYPPDSSEVKKVVVVKTDSIFKVNGYACKGITLRSESAVQRFYYTESLHNNLAFDKDFTPGQYNVYARETGAAVYLWARTEYPMAVVTDSCIRIEQKGIDDHTFDLPALPMKKFDAATMHSIPRFPGKEGAWLKYLQTNLDANLAVKYVKIAKDQQQASVTVQVEFVVDRGGNISNIQVINKKEVHSKLAAEAVRVIQESPRWIPAQFYGQPVDGSVRQPVVFAVMR